MRGCALRLVLFLEVGVMFWFLKVPLSWLCLEETFFWVFNSHCPVCGRGIEVGREETVEVVFGSVR